MVKAKWSILFLMASNFFSIAMSVRVVTLPVGQGDSAMIECPGTNGQYGQNSNGGITFIDMGSLRSTDAIDRISFVNEVMRYTDGGRRLKRIFFTHPDADHINFASPSTDLRNPEHLLPQLVKSKKAKNIDIHIGYEDIWKREKDLAARLIDYVEKDQTGTLELKGNDKRKNNVQICGQNVYMTIIDSGYRNSINNPTNSRNSNSMIMKLVVGTGNKRVRMLFTGDVEDSGNDKVIAALTQNNNIRAEVVMIPHHGSNTNGNGNAAFYMAVGANYGIISSGIGGSKHHHPTLQTIRAFCRNQLRETCDINTGIIYQDDTSAKKRKIDVTSLSTSNISQKKN